MLVVVNFEHTHWTAAGAFLQRQRQKEAERQRGGEAETCHTTNDKPKYAVCSARCETFTYCVTARLALCLAHCCGGAFILHT